MRSLSLLSLRFPRRLYSSYLDGALIVLGVDGVDGRSGGRSGNIITSSKLFNRPNFSLSLDGSTLVVSDEAIDQTDSTIYTFKIENNQMTSLGVPFETSNRAVFVHLNSDGTKLLYSDYSGEVSQFNLVNNNWELHHNFSFGWAYGEPYVVSDDFSTIVGPSGITLNFNGTEWVNTGSEFNGQGVGGSGQKYDINVDGSVLIYGNLFANNNTGIVRVFQKLDNNWIQMGDDMTGPELEPPYLSRFGDTVDISDDGMTIGVTSGQNTYEYIYSIYSFNQGQWELKGSQERVAIDVNIFSIGYPSYSLYNNGDSFCKIVTRRLSNGVDDISILSISAFNTDWVEQTTGYSSTSSASFYNVEGNGGSFVKSGTVVYFKNIGLGNDELQLIVRFVN